MKLNKIFIQNYKSFREFELDFNDDLNIIVGDNEVGKSTLLEAINLVFTGQLNGRNIFYELTPYLFNNEVVKEYIEQLRKGKFSNPPQILIELYLKDSNEVAKLLGTNNSKKENEPGIFMSIEFNDEYAHEYQNYISKPDEIRTVPIEYYDVKWYSFAHNSITPRSIPVNISLVDTSMTRLQNGADQYISKIINDALDVKERVDLALSFRKLKETFASEKAIKSINSNLLEKKGEISDKELSISVDISPRTNWEASLTSYLNDIPFQLIGKGEQNTVKMNLALETRAQESHLVLIEEPENHLSYPNMNKLIKKISDKCKSKQLILTTHSTYVLNKLGLEKLILLNKNKKALILKDLNKDTQNYFKKLPGYDTLRMLLAEKAILVEGPSDELIIQKAYFQSKGKLPIEDGIDVISVRGLAFKRFLEIAQILQKDICLITDNDGNVQKLKSKYDEYLNINCINICYDEDETLPTLEPQLVNCNELDNFNEIFGTKIRSKEDLCLYMENNKTECALKIFESKKEIVIPRYINDAIK